MISSNLSIFTEADCLQGSVKSVQVKCQEKPYFLNRDGNISFRTHEYVIADIDRRMSSRFVGEIIDSLNEAFRLGYETDRIKYE